MKWDEANPHDDWLNRGYDGDEPRPEPPDPDDMRDEMLSMEDD